MPTGYPVIYQSLKEIVDPAHTILVAWDIQNTTANRAFNKEECLNNIKAIMAAARQQNVPLVYTKITRLPQQFASSWTLFMTMRRYKVDDPEKIPQLKPGSFELEIHDAVKPNQDDLILPKYTPNIFLGTHFEHLLQNRGVTTILFTGFHTDMGIDTSARDASARGFYTIVLQDCVSASERELHESSLKSLKNICLVEPSSEIIKAWG
jgi:nicotinamidase-related amidase